jgi:phytoene desaturase
VIEKGVAKKLVPIKASYVADVVISGADYHFTETALLPPQYRSYTEGYGKKSAGALLPAVLCGA